MSSSSTHTFRKSVLEAAAEISHEFSDHYWKDVLENGKNVDQSPTNPASNETIKNGFIFYLNASGRYLILREHLRNSISNVVQQRCLNLHPTGFHNHRDFQSFLHDMYVYLVDEMHEILSSTTLHETDPLESNANRLLQQAIHCNSAEELSKASLHQRKLIDLGLFAEEAFAQGDFDSCHRLHLQRTCIDKESSARWTEFAVMWLGRGDDRMAEISVREALRKDPLHFYALLISGLISVRHNDERGLDCLMTALGLRPMAPEIIVIVGLANSLLGKESDADYYFRKAAYVHRTVTGKSTQDLGALFNKNTKPFNMKEFTDDMEAGIHPPQESLVVKHSDEQVARPTLYKKERKSFQKSGSKIRIGNDDELGVKKRTSGKKQELAALQQGNPDFPDNALLETPAKERKSIDLATNKRKVSIVEAKDESVTKVKVADADGEELTSRQLPPALSPSNEANVQKPSFLEELTDISPEEVELPPLHPSILVPWNVTEYNENLEKHLLTVDYLKSSDKKAVTQESHKKMGNSGTPVKKGSSATPGVFNTYIPNDEGVATDKELREAYDQLISETEGEIENATSRGSIKGTSSQVAKRLSDGTRKRASEEKRRGSKLGSGLLQVSQPTTPGDGLDEPKPVSVMDASKLQDSSQILTNRLGTELMWAAQLLVNLRLFDFADGILAKHLYFYAKRTMQFLYLRALSLYLRQRESEAIPLLKEAIELDNTNTMFWTLKGHCYTATGSVSEAVESYEKALKLPYTDENRHLLYLRYGTLILGIGKNKLAKRIFLHGVSKYPTPYMWLSLGNACFRRLEYDQAESAFSEANRLDSTNPITWGHLALCSLVQGKKTLAEQAYKWALRYGLKKGDLLDEIHELQRQKGFGDPSFPRVPSCVPHDYYLRRMGRSKPFNLYKEALNQDPPRMGKDRFGDTDNEVLLKRKLEMLTSTPTHLAMEWGGEGYFGGDEGFTEGDVDDEYMHSPYLINATKDENRASAYSRGNPFKEQGGPGEILSIKAPVQ